MHCKKFVLEWLAAYVGLVLIFEATFRPISRFERPLDILLIPFAILFWLAAIFSALTLGLPVMLIVGLMEEFGLVKSPPRR